MAQLMADSDLAIGAAGATSWERCCLGLPSVMFPLAENQDQSCRALTEAGAGLMLEELEALSAQLQQVFYTLAHKPLTKFAMIKKSAQITDGKGIERAIQSISI